MKPQGQLPIELQLRETKKGFSIKPIGREQVYILNTQLIRNVGTLLPWGGGPLMLYDPIRVVGIVIEKSFA